jgi:hypothetical protein
MISAGKKTGFVEMETSIGIKIVRKLRRRKD